MTKDISNITKTQRVLDTIRMEIKKYQLIGEQGMLIIAREELPRTKVDDQLSVEESFLGILSQIDSQLNNLIFLEEVYKSHIKIMKETNKVTESVKKTNA